VGEAGAGGEAITMIRVAETEISPDLHGDLQLLLQECFAGYPGRSYFKLPAHFRYLAMTGSGGVAAQMGVEYRIIRVGDAVLRTFGIVDLCVGESRRRVAGSSRDTTSTGSARLQRLGQKGLFQYIGRISRDGRSRRS
jgi:hypothetical protein